MQNTGTSDIPLSVGWICTSPLQFATAKAMLSVGSSKKHDNLDAYSGCIGGVNVTIDYIPPSLHPTDVAIAVQSMMTSPTNIKSILVMGAISGLYFSDTNPGDLIINTPAGPDKDRIESSPTETRLSQQAAILLREVGHDGTWLSSNLSLAVSSPGDHLISIQPPESRTTKYPRLHYGNLSQNRPKGEIAVARSVKDFDTIIKAFENLIVDIVTILTIAEYEGSNGSAEEYAPGGAASAAKELIRGMCDGLTKNLESLRGTETIVPPYPGIKVPSFEPQSFLQHGDAVLLVIPTANTLKGKLLRDGLERQKSKDVILHSISLPFDSGVGEQPYNEAGMAGACGRISNALRHLNATEYQGMLASKGIGTVLIASIENYIQLDNVKRPTDYGVVVIHNVSRGATTAGLSWGVTVPPGYVDRARRFGFDGNPNYGRVTVGQVLAAHVPGLDKADFHSVLAGRSRYDLLSDVIDRLSIPW